MYSTVCDKPLGARGLQWTERRVHRPMKEGEGVYWGERIDEK